ncbi:MAG: MBL fold metallo-hydrolase [Sulfurimonas sp.]|jgi:glyoxylase-like metal-dependent hydrolase (beta-lactamase superfamily II)|nr:MBL fold metallo-hydrolase [Sulfurimonadaceae bacterium]
MIRKIFSPVALSVSAMVLLMSGCSDDTTASSSVSQASKPAEVAPVATPAPVAEAPKTVEADEFAYKVEPKKVADNVWCFFGALEMPTRENGGEMANNCFIKGDDSYVVWDTGPSYVYAKQAYAAMAKEAGELPVKYVIISHEHDDHWFGNSYYKDVHGAEIIGPEAINLDFEIGSTDHRMFDILSEDALGDTKVIHVDKFYKEITDLNLAGIDLQYVPVGNAHSKEDFFLWMPSNKLILAGDIVMNGRVTSNRDGSVEGSIAALETINAKDWEVLIPGHGFIIDKTATDEYVEYFTMMRDRIEAAMDEGIDETGIVEAVPMVEFKDKPLYEALHGLNVSRAYQEYDMGL